MHWFRFHMEVVLSLCLFASTHSYGSAGAQASSAKVAEEIVRVTFCDLVKSPQKYHDMVVRIQANLDLADGFLYDLQCNSPDWWLRPTLETTRPPDLTTLHAAISELPGGSERLRVTLVGRFSGPMGTAYGTGALRQQIAIFDYENVDAVPPDEPKAIDTKEPAPLTELNEELNKLALQWIQITTVGNAVRFAELATDDYIWVDDDFGAVTKGQLLRDSERLKRPELVGGQEFSGGVQVFEFDDLAVVVHVFEDTTMSVKARYTNVFRKKDMEWGLIFTRSTRRK